jgi:hypothetical protein
MHEIDKCHSKRSTVTTRMIQSFLKREFNISVSQPTVLSYFNKLGLTWKTVKNKKRNVGGYRMDLVRDFIIEFNSYYEEFKKNPDDCDFVFVFTDESYIHKGHSFSNSFLNGDCTIIMMHAITPFGPLCEKIDGIPVDDLIWNGDTPRPTIQSDNLLSCETLWKAESRSGDYHDNMNSEMFMKWTEERLVPTFNKQMILICDNAPYHHCREIGNIGGKSKKRWSICV